jgi:hypothetical protein
MIKATVTHALHYASMGIPVLPLHHLRPDGICSCGGTERNPGCKPGKHPFGALVPHGLQDATTDPEKIRRWFEGEPYNVGVCTGDISGFFVLDRDDRDGGDISLAELEGRYSPIPATVTQTTGNGKHYLFRMPVGQAVKNSVKRFAAGLDIRGTGGYVVAPPSKHANGRTYAWDEIAQLDPSLIADAPNWLLELTAPSPPSIIPWDSALHPTDKPGMSSNDLATGFKWPEIIRDGQGREDFILRAASHLRGVGDSQAAIEKTLSDYNAQHISPPLNAEVVLDRARRYSNAGKPETINNLQWREPEPLKSTLPNVPKFDKRLLPSVFRDWLFDIGDQMQCPIEFLAVGAMVAAGAVVGNRIGVQPKRFDTGWVEVPNLWGAVVGRPGVMKSPALAKVYAPLRRLEQSAQVSFSAALAQYALDRMLFEAAKKQAEASLRKGAVLTVQQMPVEPIEPQPKRYLINDATYQKIGQVLSGNPHGLMVFQDELSGLLMRLETTGQESSRGFYLEAWDGKQSYTFDRIERGTTLIPMLCFSVMGGLQPSKLREYLRSAVYGGRGDDGLAQRLQMLVYPDIPAQWTRVDRQPDLAAADAADAVFDRLANLDPAAIGAQTPLGGKVPILNFDDPAQDLFNNWWTSLETSIRTAEQHPALESHTSKYRKLVPAIALLDHLISGRQGAITVKSVGRAIAWQTFLLEHAKRAYASVTSATMDAAKALSKQIQRGALSDGFTIREVYRHNWSLLSNAKEVGEAVEVLADLGWLHPAQDSRQSNTDGRPTVRYYINPRIKSAA